MDDNGIVRGVVNSQSLRTDLFNCAANAEKVNINLLSPDGVQIHQIGDKEIISIMVPELPVSKKPLYLNGNPMNSFIRRGEGDYKVTDEELRRFLRDGRNELDSDCLEGFDIDDLDVDSVVALKSILSSRSKNSNFESMDLKRFLKEIGVFLINGPDRESRLCVAGLLFLGKEQSIKRYFPYFHLEFMDKRGDESLRWRDRVSTGDENYPNLNLFQFYRIVMEKLNSSVTEPFSLDSQNIRRPNSNLPIALREAFVNCLIHADYFDSESNVMVTIHDSYYEFVNPGRMKISVEQFFTGGKSVTRNPQLLNFFRRLGACERAGTGGPEIAKVISENRYKLPMLESKNHETSLKLWTTSIEESLAELPDLSRAVFSFINKTGNATIRKLREEFPDNSPYSLHRSLNQLITYGFINIKGRGPATKYYVYDNVLDVLKKSSAVR